MKAVIRYTILDYGAPLLDNAGQPLLFETEAAARARIRITGQDDVQVVAPINAFTDEDEEAQP